VSIFFPTTCLCLAASASSLDAGGLPKGKPWDESFRSPLHIRLSRDGLKAYVVNHTRGSVSIIDVRGRKVEGEFPVGRSPAHAALSPDGKLLYVSSLRDNAVRAVDLSARRTARVFKTGLGPYGVEVSSDGSRLFVVESLSDRVAILDAVSGRTLSRTPVGREAKYLALTPEGERLVAGNGLSRSVGDHRLRVRKEQLRFRAIKISGVLGWERMPARCQDQ
ncbi:MAG: YncE family protein, partial [Elusimicrobiota bacterium]